MPSSSSASAATAAASAPAATTPATTVDASAVTDAAPVQTESVNVTLENLVRLSTSMATSFREMTRTLTQLSKQIEREQRRNNRSRSHEKRVVKQKSVTVSKAMSEFMSKNAPSVQSEEGRFTRRDMMSAVSTYIKTHKLQVETNKRQWTPDATLSKLLNLKKTDVKTFMDVNGLISSVVVAAPAPVAATA